MAGDREDEDGSEDLFDDLDSFFSPLEESGSPPPSTGSQASRGTGSGESDPDAGDTEAIGTPGRPDRPSEGGTGEYPELSLEDLKKAPPQYRYLPPPPEGEEEAVDLDDLFGEPDPAAAPAGTSPRGAGEPSLEDVEAAADQLAEDYRSTGDADDLLDEMERRPEPRRIKVGEPESLMGPAWEDPTSRTLTREPEVARTGGRNLPLAIVTGAALAVAALIALAVEKWAFAIVAGIVVLLGQAELYTTIRRRGGQPATALGLVIGGFVMAGAYFHGEPGMLFFVALAVPLTLLWYMAAAPKARTDLLTNVATTLFGVVYVSFLASFVLLLLVQRNSGQMVMLATIGLTVWYDIAAFAIGTLWGSRPLAPSISPKKSWEGLFGATVATFAVAIALLPTIDILTPSRSLALAAVVVVFAPLGDLAESVIKRDLGVKDMGAILPGHGGMLDRFDSILFVAPAAFYFLRFIF